jgi:Terpene cyclase DEP1
MVALTYLILFLVGTVLPLTKLFGFMFTNGVNISLFWDQLWINDISSFFVLDIIVSALTILVLISKQTTPKKYYICIPFTILVGVSSGLPLFLFLQQMYRDTNPIPPELICLFKNK